MGNGVEYAISLGDPDGPEHSAEVAIGAPAVEVGLANVGDFDGLSFRVTNTDNSQWDVAVFMRESDGTLYKSDFVTLSLLGTAYVTLGFDALPGGAASLGPLADVGLLIRGQLDAAVPNPSNGDIAHILVEPVRTATAVPEPAAISLVLVLPIVVGAARYRTTRSKGHPCSHSRSPLPDGRCRPEITCGRLKLPWCVFRRIVGEPATHEAFDLLSAHSLELRDLHSGKG